jgi:hypothetical protein
MRADRERQLIRVLLRVRLHQLEARAFVEVSAAHFASHRVAGTMIHRICFQLGMVVVLEADLFDDALTDDYHHGVVVIRVFEP